MHRKVIINMENQCLHFSAAHFTIFSATERERLHGHNYTVRAKVESQIRSKGMAFNYNELKRALHAVCKTLDEYTLLPGRSEYLQVKEEGEHYYVNFNGQKMLLLKSDTLVLPMENISVEELGHYIIEQLSRDGLMSALDIKRMQLSVASGPGQRVVSLYEK
jgi:6-pyruvoyltetrahydropterin/6-carboxytetrahydropterin synthase